jgi:signal peptidase II
VFSRLQRYRLLFVLIVLVFAADQLSKIAINHSIPFETYFPPGRVTVIPGFFYLVHVGNTGAAWGVFEGKSVWLALLAIATLVAIFVFRRQLELTRPVVQLCFGLLCGGIVGNLVDRTIHGHVIDFLLFIFGSYPFPVFNLADSAICIGVALYLIQSLREPMHSTAA